MKRVLVIVALVCAASSARADTVTVGMFTPSAPFEGTAARVELTTKLAHAIGAALGKDGIGRVYGRAGDFAAAVKKGDVHVAVVDARYAAVAGLAGGTVVAVAVHGGGDSASWQLVARGAKSVLELKGKTLLVPSMGGREAEFVRNAMYGGELAKDFFAKVEVAPDTAAALASLALGKADAAIVPSGVDAPGGTSVVATLPSVSNAVVVVYGLDDAARGKVAAALGQFQGGGAIDGFHAAGGDVVRGLAHRMTPADKHGPMAVPDVHIGIGDLVAGRAFSIPRADVKQFVAAPAPASKP